MLNREFESRGPGKWPWGGGVNEMRTRVQYADMGHNRLLTKDAYSRGAITYRVMCESVRRIDNALGRLRHKKRNTGQEIDDAWNQSRRSKRL